jgi:hypothetical protein
MAVAAFAAISTATAAVAATVTAISSATVLGVSVATIVKVGSLALSVYSMTKKPKSSAGSPSPLAFKADPNAFITFVAGGPVAVGGNMVFGQTTGSKNKYVVYATALSHGGPCEAIHEFKADDTPVTFGADGGQGATGTYLNRMWQTTALGDPAGTHLVLSATGSKDTPGDHGGHPYEWDASHKLCGIAQSLWCCEADPNIYPGLPKPLWVLTGGPVYDPRQDDTQAGGVGPQRWNDRATWSRAGNKNPFLQAISFAIGHYYNGIRIGGAGLNIEAIDVPAFAYGANVAEANGWLCAYPWNTGMRKWDVIATMLQAGAGSPLMRAGKLSCSVEAPRVSIDTITETDLRGDFSVTASPMRRDRYNTLIPRCKSPENNWAVLPFGKVSADTYLDEDGGWERPKEVEYEAVNGSAQCRQLAAYDLANIREGIAATLPLSARFLRYRAGDCLTVSAPSTLMNGQKVVVLKREFDPRARIVHLTVRSETDEKHAWALGQSNVPPRSPVLTGWDGIVIQPPDPALWTPSAGATPGADDAPRPPGDPGPQSPVLIIEAGDNEGSHVDDPAADAIVVRYRRKAAEGQPDYTWVYDIWPPKSARIEVTGSAPNTTYEIEIAYRVRGVIGEFTRLADVTTGPTVSNSANTIGDMTAADIQAAVEDAEAAAEEARQAAQEASDAAAGAVEGLADEVARALAAEDALHQEIVSLSVTVGSNTAAISDEVVARADADTALAARITALEATSGDASAAIIEEAAVRAAADSAIAARTTTLETQMGDTIARVTATEVALSNDVQALASYKVEVAAEFGKTNANVTTEQIARSNADNALGARLTTVEASFSAAGNILNNATFADGLNHWAGTGGLFVRAVDPAVGPMVQVASNTTGAQQTFASDTMPCHTGGAYSLSFSGDAGTAPVATGWAIQWLSATDTFVGWSAGLTWYAGTTNWTDKRGKIENQIAPAGAVRFRVMVFVDPGAGVCSFNKVMLNWGPTAIPFNDQKSINDLSARVTTEEIARASADSAIAARTTTVEASLRSGAPNLIKNSDFSDGLKYWTQYGAGGNGYTAYVHPSLGNILIISPWVASNGLFQDVAISAGTQYVMSGEGSLVPAGLLYTQYMNAARDTILLSVSGGPEGWDSRASVVSTAPAGAAWARLYVAMGGVDSPAASVGRLMFQRGAVATAWTNETAQGEVSARVTVSEAAVVTLQGKTSAYWQVVVDAGTAQSYIRAAADGNNGEVTMAADRIALYNRVGNNMLPAMVVVGGNARFTGNVQIDGNLTIAGTINTPAVVDNAINRGISAGTNSRITAIRSDAVYVVSQTVVLSCTGKPVSLLSQLIYYTAGNAASNTNPYTVALKITRDGADIYNISATHYFGSLPLIGMMDDAPPAGDHTYVLWYYIAASQKTYYIDTSYIAARETKK